MIIVTCAVIERNNQVLIAKRKRGNPLENKWEFPGGKIEPGETPEECLKREPWEEFGIDASVKDFLCSSSYDYPIFQLNYWLIV